jgi:hypothetical protein
MNTTPCGCALRCFEKISEEKRKGIFEKFWESGNFDTQNACLPLWLCKNHQAKEAIYQQCPVREKCD